ncbi:hypothetical protein CP533_1465 [Ophiocordyceps camponoti-saundersi (nom. inval.)]|nr:hypothetical protein CP533_1465 [Ophiocordyceps camponoti-saundersi (nom. inval.)]
MSPVDVAMVGRDLRSTLRQLVRRDLLIDAADRVGDVKTAFSSWDNCMKVGYCKWPVIAVIAVGSLILFSIAWCIIRRLCCGLACCCSCFQCLRCCGNCCGCCDAPNRRQQNYLEEPYIPPGHGYQSQPPMFASGAFPPQYAQFDVPRKGGADALPEMPSWESGSSKKVMVEDDEVEMNQLSKRVSSPLAQAPMAPSTVSSTLVYTPGYGHQSPDVSYERGYFDHEPNNNSYGLAQPTPRSPSRPYNLMHQDTGDSFGRMGHGASPYPSARAEYQYPPSSTPAPREQQDYPSAGYGYDYPAHSTSPPAEAWPHSSQPASHQSPPITNNAGFDFTSGYARPTNTSADPPYPTPPTSTPVYPGYKPYQPPS